jgi:hypothetical protein
VGRFLAGVGFAVGFAWFFRRRKKEKPGADPAEALKRKLDETRAAESEAEPAQAPPVEQPERPLDERREDVHRRARESIERMRGEE